MTITTPTEKMARYDELLTNHVWRQRELRNEYPNAPMAACGTCDSNFPDVFPSARCPFEYEHDEIAELRQLRNAITNRLWMS